MGAATRVQGRDVRVCLEMIRRSDGERRHSRRLGLIVLGDLRRVILE
jgi:hypothetical protein